MLIYHHHHRHHQIRDIRLSQESTCTCMEDFHFNVLLHVTIYGDIKFHMRLKDFIQDLLIEVPFGIEEIIGNWYQIIKTMVQDVEVSMS